MTSAAATVTQLRNPCVQYSDQDSVKATHSIDIHLPQCERLWMQRQAKLPKSKRKPVPQLLLLNRNKRMTLEERNEMAMGVYQDTALAACNYCCRTFLPDRLVVHLRSCAPRNHGKRRPPSPREEARANHKKE
jgi:hypothetical protein